MCTPAHKCPECVQPRLSLDRVSLIALHISTCTGDGALATRLTHWIWVSHGNHGIFVGIAGSYALASPTASSFLTTRTRFLIDTHLVNIFINTPCSEEECSSKCLRKLNIFFMFGVWVYSGFIVAEMLDMDPWGRTPQVIFKSCKQGKHCLFRMRTSGNITACVTRVEKFMSLSWNNSWFLVKLQQPGTSARAEKSVGQEL